MKQLKRKWCLLLAVVLMLTILPVNTMPVWAAEVTGQSQSNKVYDSIEEAAAYLRDEMMDRVQNVTVRIKRTAVTDASSSVLDILNEAKAYKRGASGQAGDALASAISNWGCSISSNGSVYTLTYEFGYYTTYEQEAELTAAVNNALASLKLDNKSAYDKIKTIYDYICDHVDYDYDGLNDESNNIKFSAYSALINGKAVCQGYAVLFYRMCMDAGIPARIITGYGNGGPHAWNIVEINGYYYNVDATWDGQDAETGHDYFLKNESDFMDHVRNNAYNTSEFNAQFPMAEKSCVNADELEAPMKAANFDYTFQTLNGGSVSSKAQGKPKLLIFFSDGCYYSRRTISSLSKAEFGDVDIICMNTSASGSLEATKAFSEEYGSSSMIFSAYYYINNTAMWKYVEAKFGRVNSITWPVIAYIDSYNTLLHVTSGYQPAGTVRTFVDYYCKNVINELPHNHIYSDAWLTDVNSHWHVCVAEGCDGSAVSDKTAHTAGDWIVDKAATTEETGSKHKECTSCGYVMQTERIEKLHGHKFTDNWTNDENYHWHVCTAGGCDGTVSGKAAHTAGQWIVDKEATMQSVGSKHKECTTCGYVMVTETIPKLVQTTNAVITDAALYTAENTREHILIGVVASTSEHTYIEYRWSAKDSSGNTQLIQDWTLNNEWLNWIPDGFGEYTLIAEARVAGNPASSKTVEEVVYFNPYIKGKCQLPYAMVAPGQPGYLIGVETYENPNQEYQYEMLILNCTSMQWVYSTGKFTVNEGAAGWCVWQPEYGYYWTLFRVYDKEGNMIDQACYGFVNAY